MVPDARSYAEEAFRDGPVLGSQVTELALPLVALLQLGATSTAVGVLRALEFVPYLLLTLPVGMLADRRRRRPEPAPEPPSGPRGLRAMLAGWRQVAHKPAAASQHHPYRRQQPVRRRLRAGPDCLRGPRAGLRGLALAPSAGPIPVLVAGQVILGMGIALFNLQSLSLRQAITTPSRWRSSCSTRVPGCCWAARRSRCWPA
jgi:MFS family permease